MEIAISSHDDPWSVSGACAIAAAICEAMKYDATVYSIVQAAKYGCREGEALARKRTDIHVYPGPSVAKRLDMAIDIALHTSDDKNPVDERVTVSEAVRRSRDGTDSNRYFYRGAR